MLNGCLTTDSWTSQCTENYLGFTTHYITSNFEIGSCLLELLKYTDRHIADSLSDELKCIISAWNLTGKVVAVVTDNVPNQVAAVTKAELSHIPWYAHTLNIIVQNTVNGLQDLKTMVKAFVEHFR